VPRNVNLHQARWQPKGFACDALQHVLLALLLYLSGLQLLSMQPKTRTYSRGSERTKRSQPWHDPQAYVNQEESGAGGAVTKHFCLTQRQGEVGMGNHNPMGAAVCTVPCISTASLHRLAMYGHGSAFICPTPSACFRSNKPHSLPDQPADRARRRIGQTVATDSVSARSCPSDMTPLAYWPVTATQCFNAVLEYSVPVRTGMSTQWNLNTPHKDATWLIRPQHCLEL
jgi:hypothetical protein